MLSVKRPRRNFNGGALRWIVGLLTLIYFQGCGSATLKPWHTEKLDAEFTADKADEVVSFDDYLRLEDKVFAQLKEQVYARTETGPEHALERYSAGSAADPQQLQPNWNRSFELTSEKPTGGVLLLHSMSDSPYSLRALGETLNAQGYLVLGLRLPGHGTAPSGLKNVRWQNMAAAVSLGMSHLVSKVGQESIHIVGYSTGAPLALDFTLNARQGDALPVPASLILISPAIGISPAAALATWKRRMSLIPGLGGLAWLQIQPEFDPYKYNSFATNAGVQVHRLTRSVSRRVAAQKRSNPKKFFPPILVLKSTVDATISTDAAVDRLLVHLAPNRHELVLFDINHYAAKSILLVSDPGPLTARVMEDATLPFAVTLVTNENPDSTAVVAEHEAQSSAKLQSSEPLALAWPTGVISLSHIALPFPLEDPLYGQRPPDSDDVLFLGQMDILGERGLMKISSDWLLRLRHNSFYDYLERRVLEWVNNTQARTARSVVRSD